MKDSFGSKNCQQGREITAKTLSSLSKPRAFPSVRQFSHSKYPAKHGLHGQKPLCSLSYPFTHHRPRCRLLCPLHGLRIQENKEEGSEVGRRPVLFAGKQSIWTWNWRFVLPFPGSGHRKLHYLQKSLFRKGEIRPEQGWEANDCNHLLVAFMVEFWNCSSADNGSHEHEQKAAVWGRMAGWGLLHCQRRSLCWSINFGFGYGGFNPCFSNHNHQKRPN